MNCKSSHSVVSFFSGLGGLDLGFEWEGFRVIWANDVVKNATETFRTNFGLDPIVGDISDIPIDDIPDADVMIGGPPCQSFSLVGQRRPRDERGRLGFRYLDILLQKQPSAFVIENVPGMNASFINGVRLPEFITERLEEAGYLVQKMELTATDYLVPQLRKRLVLVGCKGVRPRVPDPILFARSRYGIDLFTYDSSAKAAIGDLGPCSPKGSRARYAEVEPSDYARIMRSAGLKDVSLHECPRMSETDKRIVAVIPPGGNYMDIPDEIAPGRVLKFKATGGRTTTYGRLHPERPAYTINTYFRRPNVGCNFHYCEQRLITPREAMRFQSIPDQFELTFGSQDERNAFIGNAVPPMLARAIAMSVSEALRQQPLAEDRRDSPQLARAKSAQGEINWS